MKLVLNFPLFLCTALTATLGACAVAPATKPAPPIALVTEARLPTAASPAEPPEAQAAEPAAEPAPESPREALDPKSIEALKKFATWEAVRTPTQGPTQIIGSYASGCISGARPLPLKSPNYVVMRASRNAYYGDPSLLDYIAQLSERARDAGLPRLMIEDLGRPRGGPYAKGHGSHQIGLDVDVSLTPTWPGMAAHEAETFFGPSYVADRKKLLPTWTQAQTKIVSLAADFDNVARIFVSPAIKKYFCENFRASPWLYKLRPWWGHEDHIHIRLNCPKGSTTKGGCKTQAPLNPKEDPCGRDLAWWYSADGEKKWREIQAFWTTGQSKEFPKIPNACEDVRRR